MSHVIKCPDCGFQYCDDIASDNKKHNKIHNQFLDAKSQYTHIYLYEEEEHLKRMGWDIVQNERLSLPEKTMGAEQVCHSFYSRSMAENGFSAKHPKLVDYIAMLLDAEEYWKTKFTPLVYNAMLEKYSKKPGLKHGNTIYHF